MKTVLVTGGSGGIGGALVKAFFSSGCRVIMTWCQNRETAEALQQELDPAGERLMLVQADLTSADGVEALFSKVNASFGGVDILVNNAGTSLYRLMQDTLVSEWDNVMNTNARGVFLTSRGAVGHMIRQQWGRIINITSAWGICGAAMETAYSASKAAVHGFSKALAKELAPSGITVNCIAPGFTDTKMNSHLSKAETEDFLSSSVPACRAGRPEEVASLAVYLASEEAAYITGQIIGVDGGLAV